MGYRLPQPLVPEPGESLPGLIMRNAAAYRFTDPTRVLRRLNPPKVILVSLCQADPAGPLGTAMRDALGLDGAEWGRLAMGTDGDTTIRLNRHVVWREQARLDARTVCPACLAEAPCHRAVWFLDALPICAVHGIRLDPAEVERVLPASRATMSAIKVGGMMGVHYSHVLHWARRGLMATVPPGGPGEVGLRFSRADVDAFLAEFVLGGELARMDADGGRPNGAMTRHLRFMGVAMVSGPGAGDGGKLAVFRRAEVTPEVLARVGQVRQRRAVPTRELRQRGYERVALAAEAIGKAWGARLRRVNNRFTDEATGRVVQVVSGRRPDLMGVFMFNVQRESLDILRRAPDAWVALVPNEGETFLLLPLAEVRWRGTGAAHHITVRFDGQGLPTDLVRFALPLVPPSAEAA